MLFLHANCFMLPSLQLHLCPRGPIDQYISLKHY
uniref:Uncharacterized protein n=1 Tax=Arundo donax TaxID=35708 RepID=A0A0A8ZW70_ARUDO